MSATLSPEHQARDDQIRQAPQDHHPKLVTHKEVRAKIHGTSPMGRFNDRLAVLITKGVGTMWCAYIFTLLAILGFPGLTFDNGIQLVVATPHDYVQWISTTFLQLVLLAVIMVGQNVISVAQDARAESDHDTLIALHEMSKQQIKILEGQNQILDLIENKVGKA
ncbi:MAG TPA: hypothetical protein VG329_03315 [Candidatus Dormibacteraeota bacterium]|jgi:hypothetical protein|nr:hypothetical protein [Candidatus Dormibacteraeota bacterium]